MKKNLFSMLVLCLIGLQSVLAQSREVSGVITALDDGLSIPGVSVVIKGTTIGTTTDFDGKYTISIPEDGQTLVFSFVGMKTTELAINSTTINLVMESESIGMNEVVVTAMGIKKSAKSVTYAVSSISGSDAAAEAEPDVIKALKGKIAGVDVKMGSSVGGGASRITIRGASSFKGDNQPLFVVDGVPYQNSSQGGDLSSGMVRMSGISTLDPNDIKTMNVLKGAAAAALYGSRAANGVVLITTKSGSSKGSEKLNVSFSSTAALETIASLPDYQNTYGNGYEMNASASSQGSWGAKYSDVNSVANYPAEWQSAYPKLYGGERPYTPQPDNVKDMFRTGTLFQNSVGISGGSDNINASLTLSDLRQKSYIPHSYFNKTNISLGVNLKVSDRLKVGAKLSYSTIDRNSPLVGNDGSFRRALFMGRSWDTGMPYEGPNGESLYYVDGEDNPMWSWKHNKNKQKYDRIVMALNTSYNVFDWLDITYDVSMNNTYNERNYITAIHSNERNDKLGSFTAKRDTREEIESLLMFRVRKSLSSDLNLRVNFGHNANIVKTNYVGVAGSPYISPGIFQLDNTTTQTASSTDEERRLWALLAEVGLEYRNYLFFTFTARNDFSSTLPKQNNSFVYPSVSTSFDFSEAFDLTSDVFSSGLLRASWAKVGNDAGVYDANNVYKTNYANNGSIGSVPSSGFPFGGQNMQTPYFINVDPNLEPEFTEEYEFGTKLSFLDSKFNADITYYSKSSTNQILTKVIPTTSGSMWYRTNGGEIKNKGVEIVVDGELLNTNGFKWDASCTFSKNVSEVIIDKKMNTRNLYGGGIASFLTNGRPYGVFEGYGAARDKDGNILINPKTGLMIKSAETFEIGDPNPDFQMGLMSNLSYKGFSLGMTLEYTHGGDLYSSTVQRLIGRGVTKDTEDRERTRIIKGVLGNNDLKTPLLDKSGNTIPNNIQISTNALYFEKGGLGLQMYDEFNVYDATTFRVSEVSLGYTFPKSVVSKLNISAASLGLTGYNLFWFSPGFPEHTNYDPATGSFGSGNTQGIEYGSAPSMRRFSLSLNVKF